MNEDNHNSAATCTCMVLVIVMRGLLRADGVVGQQTGTISMNHIAMNERRD